MQSACALLYCHLAYPEVYHVFPHYLINDTIFFKKELLNIKCVLIFSTRVGTLIVATIYLQLIQNRYMFRSFTVLQCSYQHCVQPVASDVKVVGYL